MVVKLDLGFILMQGHNHQKAVITNCDWKLKVQSVKGIKVEGIKCKNESCVQGYVQKSCKTEPSYNAYYLWINECGFD